MVQRETIHLASTHSPFDTRIFQKECKTLVQAGYRVTLIVPHDRDESVEGVHIKAVPLPKKGSHRLTKTLGHIYRAALAESPKALYHFHDAELIFHMMVLKLRGRCVVYDAHEDTPKQVMHQHWIPRFIRPLVSLVMRFAEWIGGRLFNGVIAAEPGIFNRFPAKKRLLLHNFPILAELASATGLPYQKRRPVVAYVGGISVARGVKEMLAALSRLPADLQAEMLLGGPFYPKELEEQVKELPGAERTKILGWLGREAVADVLGKARMGIVTIHPTRKYVESYPTKLFEYMSVSLPVIASDFPGWRPFVEGNGCGLMVDPLDPDAIANAIQWLLEHPAAAAAMGARGRDAIEKKYNWGREVEGLLAFYDRIYEGIDKRWWHLGASS